MDINANTTQDKINCKEYKIKLDAQKAKNNVKLVKPGKEATKQLDSLQALSKGKIREQQQRKLWRHRKSETKKALKWLKQEKKRRNREQL
jgi:ribonuclease BN (tRNA processing enzyme)